MAYIDRINEANNLSVIMNNRTIYSTERDDDFDIGSFDDNYYNIKLISRHCADGRNIIYRSDDRIFSVTETIGNNIVIEDITAELFAEFQSITYDMELEVTEVENLTEQFVYCFEPIDKDMTLDYICTETGNLLYYSNTIENWIYFNYFG